MTTTTLDLWAEGTADPFIYVVDVPLALKPLPKHHGHPRSYRKGMR